MGPNCPTCKKSEFSYRAVRSLHPFVAEFQPTSIQCPSCGDVSRITTKSRMAAAFLVLAFTIAPPAVMLWLQANASGWLFVISGFAGLAFYYFAIWPFIVRLKPWSEWQYWLPKSRLVAYSVYLLLPVGTLVLMVYLAAKFELGM